MCDNIVADAVKNFLRLIKTTPLTRPLSMLTDHAIIYAYYYVVLCGDQNPHWI